LNKINHLLNIIYFYIHIIDVFLKVSISSWRWITFNSKLNPVKIFESTVGKLPIERLAFVTFFNPVNSKIKSNKNFFRNYLWIQTKRVILQSVYYPSVKDRVCERKHFVFVPISLIQMQDEVLRKRE